MFKRKKAKKSVEASFLEATRNGDLGKILEYLKNGADVNFRNENGLTGLHLSSREDHVDILLELLKRGAEIDATTTEKGNSPLHFACLSGKLDAVKILLQHGANVNLKTQNGLTPLYMASQENCKEIVEFLIKQGANIHVKTKDGFLPLDIAIQQGNGKVIELLLKAESSMKVILPALHVAAKQNNTKAISVLVESGYKVNELSESGFTALQVACHYGNYDAIRMLIEKGADINFKGKNDITALHVSSRHGHSAVVDLLLSHAVQPNSQTTEGLTALHCASANGHETVVESLIKNGAAISVKTKNGLSPLHMALQQDHAGCVHQLLVHDALIDDVTEDGLTPLHVAVHYGNMRSAKLLLDSNCDVNPKALNGLTPLHVACKKSRLEMAQLLLRYEADVNATSNSGLTPIHIASFMGHADVVNFLVQHGADSDISTVGGRNPLFLAALANKTETIQILLQNGVNIDSKSNDELTPLHVASQLGNFSGALLLLEHGASPDAVTVDGYKPLDLAIRAANQDIVNMLLDHGACPDEKRSFKKIPSVNSSIMEFSRIREDMKYIKDEDDGIEIPEIRPSSSVDSSALVSQRSKPSGRDSGFSQFSQGTISPLLPNSPTLSFWASFITDARGGDMFGCRHSGVRFILPPTKVPMPMGIKCKLVRKEKLPHPPPLVEGEALSCRAVHLAPAGSRFLGPVILEVPHFASLRGNEREILVLRSDNGINWNEHSPPPIDDLEQILKDALISEESHDRRLLHIITTELPQYFALVSRIRKEQKTLFTDEDALTSTVVPKVKAYFPEDSFRRNTKIGLQSQPVQSESVRKILGQRSLVSPLVTVDPRRRKFHRPITLTIPMQNVKNNNASDLRLLCSVSDDRNPVLWEDITNLTPLTCAGDMVSFTTSVSGKYWLVDDPEVEQSLRSVEKLYKEIMIPVPFMSRFVIFAKRPTLDEGRLRVFCMTDDKIDKTLERQEQFIEVARSDDVEVLEGRPQYIVVEGNILPITNSSTDQLHINFHAFRENRLPFTVHIIDTDQEARGHVTFLRDRGAREPSTEICTLEVVLPEFNGESRRTKGTKIGKGLVVGKKKPQQSHGEAQILKADLLLTDIAESLAGDWKPVASCLGISSDDIETIQSEYDTPVAQALVMLHLWVQKNGSDATGNRLEKALNDLGLDDIIASCMYNIAKVTDDDEKAAAKSYLDAGFDPLKAELDSVPEFESSRGSSILRSISPDAAYQEDGLSKKSTSFPYNIMDSDGNKHLEDLFRETKIGERFPFMDSSVSTLSTQTLVTLPSDGETTDQPAEFINDDDIILKTEVEEDEEILPDGGLIQRKIVTVKHLKRSPGFRDVLTGIEVEENILEIPSGITLPLASDVEMEKLAEEFVENSAGGVWSKKKRTTMKVKNTSRDKETLTTVKGENTNMPLEVHEREHLAVHNGEANVQRENVTLPPSEIATEREHFTLPPSEIATEREHFTLPPGEENIEKTLFSFPSDERTIEREHITLPPGEMTAKRENFTLPPSDVNADGDHITLPPGEITVEKEHFTLPPGETTAEKEHFTLPPGEMITEREYFTLPPGDKDADGVHFTLPPSAMLTSFSCPQEFLPLVESPSTEFPVKPTENEIIESAHQPVFRTLQKMQNQKTYPNKLLETDIDMEIDDHPIVTLNFSDEKTMKDEQDDSSSCSSSLSVYEDAIGDSDPRLNTEAESSEATTTEMKHENEVHTRILLKRIVHKKTILTGVQEETTVTEDTQIEQDNETPDELRFALHRIIDLFLEGAADFSVLYSAA